MDTSDDSDGVFGFDDPNNLLETHLVRTKRGARWIYALMVLLTVGSLSSLPLITVDVYVSAPGVIRPTSERHALTVGVDGLAIMSPDVALVGEVFVPPSDMGFIRPDGPVLLRVDAFNPQEWGVLTGRVESIGDEVIDTGSGPVFRVRTSIDRNYLELTDGHRGYLKRGMALEARFLVSRRSLLQLLRDRGYDQPVSPRLDG